MRYKYLGNTGVKVSEISIGTWAIGGSGWGETNEKDSIDAIHAMMDFGVNFIDTAPAYNAGEAERVLGKALKGKRDKAYLVTKVGTFFIDGQYVKTLEKDKIMSQIDESLSNLQTDYIDMYLIHWPDPKTPVEETMEILNNFKKQGKIRHIGVSNFTKEQIEEVSKYSEIEIIQPQYSMVNRASEPLLRWAEQQGMGAMTYGSLGAGILTGSFRTLPNFEPTDNRRRFYKHFEEPMFSKIMNLLKLMDQISEAHGNIPLSQIAINWNTQKSFVSSAIVGVRNPKEAKENCSCMDWKLSEEEIKALDQKIQEELG